MTRFSCAVFTLALAMTLTPVMTMADPHDTAADLATDATNAGTAAGIVNQCHSDAAPIRAAFMRALDQAGVDDGLRQSLWQRYRAAETETITALAGKPDTGCADTDTIIQDTVHRLERPVS